MAIDQIDIEKYFVEELRKHCGPSFRVEQNYTLGHYRIDAVIFDNSVPIALFEIKSGKRNDADIPQGIRYKSLFRDKNVNTYLAFIKKNGVIDIQDINNSMKSITWDGLIRELKSKREIFRVKKLIRNFSTVALYILGTFCSSIFIIYSIIYLHRLLNYINSISFDLPLLFVCIIGLICFILPEVLNSSKYFQIAIGDCSLLVVNEETQQLQKKQQMVIQ